MYLLVLGFMVNMMVPLAQPTQLITNTLKTDGLTDGILGGFYGGANILFGIGGLMVIVALPYGLQFAMNMIVGLLNKFGSITVR